MKSRFLQISLLITILSTLSNYSQDVDLRIETELITVPATVIDRQGRNIIGLKKEAFELFENGSKQEIALFETSEVPVTVLLLLDNSGSMNELFDDLAEAANVFVGQLKDDDQIIVATFAHEDKLNILCAATKKRDFKQAIYLTSPEKDGLTTTFNAVHNAIKYMQQFSGRKSIVLFSDGEMYGKRISAKDNLYEAEEQDSVIYTVRFGAYPTAPIGYRPALENVEQNGNSLGLSPKELQKVIDKVNGYMYGLAERTGGRGFEVERTKDLRYAFATISAELRQQYRLGYYPTTSGKNGERRKIAVKVNIPDVAVRSRNEVVFRKNSN